MNWDIVWLCLAAVAAGAVNAIAGGGTLITFPALNLVLLRFSGVSDAEAAVLANATSTVALCPGSLAGVWGYRRELEGSGRWIRLLIVPSLVGGVCGSLLVVLMDPRHFKQAVPWLILVATLLLALQPAITRWTGIGRPHEDPAGATLAGIGLFQFAIAIYGGYFGAGIGILMLSALALMGLGDIHRMNALKSLFAVAINGTSVVVFLLKDKVVWQFALPMIAAAIVGGFGGAAVARRLNRTFVRWLVIALGFALAGWYFVDTFGKG